MMMNNTRRSYPGVIQDGPSRDQKGKEREAVSPQNCLDSNCSPSFCGNNDCPESEARLLAASRREAFASRALQLQVSGAFPVSEL